MLSEARIDLSLNYEFKEKVNSYCIKIKKIQNDLNELIINETERQNDKIDKEFDIKLQQMENEIKKNIKNQVNQFTEKLIDCNIKSRSLMNESLMEEDPRREISEIKGVRDTNILSPEISIYSNIEI